MAMSFDFDAHVCLVSGQPTPNLLPVLDKQFAPAGKRVILLVSPEMREKASGLEAVFKKHGIRTERIAVENSYDFTAIQQELFACLDRPENKNAILNVTGGTKIMTLAAHSAFAMYRLPMFYVKESDNSLIVMPNSDAGGAVRTEHLTGALCLEDYLLAHGYDTASSGGRPGFAPDFAKELVNAPDKYEPGVSSLNWYAMGKYKDMLRFPIDPHDAASMRNLLDLCARHSLAHLRDGFVEFADDEARDHVCGGWLETYAYAVADGISRDKIQAKARNLTIKNKGGDNELDVVFLAKNRLHVLECKSGRLETEKGADALYKLKTLMNRTGLQTKAMLVTYHNLDKPDRQNRKPHKKRAADFGIKVVERGDLRNLKNHLEKWIAE
jgi:hypothetical protein